jgi:hypothetical protein
MAKGAIRSPVIIIGMHRSGTSLLTRMLKRTGVFVGWRLPDNQEASFFRRHNDWLLHSSGGRWDAPRSMMYLYADADGVDAAEEYLRYRVSTFPCLEFLGPARYLRYRSVFNVREPWAWKDPRNTVTLPLWIRLFPGARVVHIVRNGVDVADSLYRRQKKGSLVARQEFAKYRCLFRFLAKRAWFGMSPRVNALEEGFAMWKEYLDFADRFTKDMSNPLLQLRYEDLVADPQAVMSTVLSFCQLDPPQGALAAACADIRPDRVYLFAHDEGLTRFWQTVRHSKWMQEHDYEDCV